MKGGRMTVTGYVAQGQWLGESPWWDISGSPVSLRAARIGARKAEDHFGWLMDSGHTMRKGLRTRVIKRTIIEEGLR